MANIEKLNKLASVDSKWLDEAKYRQDNKGWLRHSKKVAIRVLRTIRELGMTQKQLAEKMGMSPQMVNKIVKGKENLTLQTIAKLEDTLGVSLIFTENSRAFFTKEYVVRKQNIYFNTNIYKTDLGTYKIPAESTEKYPLQINEPKINYGS